MPAVNVKEISHLVSQLLKLPFESFSSSYDKEGDVLYLNFKKPAYADDTELTDDDLIIRYEKGKVIGITVLTAGKRT